MKIWSSFSTEKNKCVVCNRVTYDYICYEQNGISIAISKCPKCNFNSFIADDVKNAFQIIKTSIKRSKL